MKISNNFYLNSIKKKNAYNDKKSVDPNTKKLKKKYKLAGNPIEDFKIYSFFILNSRDDACIEDLTLCIKREDWEERNKKDLKNEESFIDISKCETLSKEDLIQKIKDKRNKFEWAAKLKNRKYRELTNLLPKLKKRHLRLRVMPQTIFYLNIALEAEQVKRKLGL